MSHHFLHLRYRRQDSQLLEGLGVDPTSSSNWLGRFRKGTRCITGAAATLEFFSDVPFVNERHQSRLWLAGRRERGWSRATKRATSSFARARANRNVNASLFQSTLSKRWRSQRFGSSRNRLFGIGWMRWCVGDAGCDPKKVSAQTFYRKSIPKKCDRINDDRDQLPRNSYRKAQSPALRCASVAELERVSE